jgi:hypothetical protein
MTKSLILRVITRKRHSNLEPLVSAPYANQLQSYMTGI